MPQPVIAHNESAGRRREQPEPSPSRLFLSTNTNQHGERSAAVGKRFGRLKAEMGFGPEHVFHSIRKTAATMLTPSARGHRR